MLLLFDVVKYKDLTLMVVNVYRLSPYLQMSDLLKLLLSSTLGSACNEFGYNELPRYDEKFSLYE